MRQSAGTPLTLRPSLGTLRLSALADALRHLFPSDRIAGLLDPECGLTAEEVEERRHRYGSNGYPRDAHGGWGAILGDTVQDPMVWFRVTTALLFAWLGDYAEASVLGLALVPIEAWTPICTAAPRRRGLGRTFGASVVRAARRRGERHFLGRTGSRRSRHRW